MASRAARAPVGSRPPAWLLASLLAVFAWWAWISITQYQALQVHFDDAGFMEYSLWNSLHGHFFYAPGLYRNHMELDFSPLLVAVLPIYALVPHVLTLPLVSSACYIAAAIPLWALSARVVGDARVSIALVIAWLFNVFAFSIHLSTHFEGIGVLLVMCALFYGECRRWRAYALVAVLAALVRQDLSLYLAFYGLWLARDPASRGAGLCTFVAGLGYTAVAYVWLMPLLAGRSSSGTLEKLYPQYGTSPGEVLVGFLTHPLHLLQALFSRPLFDLLAVTGFLALLSPAALLIIPPVLPNFISPRPFQLQLLYHYAHSTLPYLFFAAVMGVRSLWAGSPRLRPALGWVLLAVAVLQAFVSLVLPTRTDGHPMRSFAVSQDDQKADAFFARTLPRDASVTAPGHLLPHLEKRFYVYPLRDFEYARYVALDLKVLPATFSVSVANAFNRYLYTSGDYQVVATDGRYVLLRRLRPATSFRFQLKPNIVEVERRTPPIPPDFRDP